MKPIATPKVIDDLRPPVPYTPGTVLLVKKHSPPSPFGPGYRFPYRHRLNEDYQECYGTPSRCCLANPPPDVYPCPSNKTYSLKIVSQLACSDCRGPQVVTCHVTGQEANLVVAKFYDPLYYNWWDLDPTYCADQDYTREAAAFSRLSQVGDARGLGCSVIEKVLEGSIPVYHGSWTWNTTLLDGQRRDVRLILMSYIPSPTMMSLIDSGDAEKIGVELRMELFAKALEVYCSLLFLGVNQNDLFPRNIAVNVDQMRVVLLDFSHAIVRDLPNSMWLSRDDETETSSRPKSPIEVFGGRLGVLHPDNWLPQDLKHDEARHAWFKRMWGGSKVFAPVSAKVAQELDIENPGKESTYGSCVGSLEHH